jgi:signal transduction histidine kinase
LKKPEVQPKKQNDVFTNTRSKLTAFYSAILTLFLLVFVAITLLVFYIVIKNDQEQTLELLSDREVEMAERALDGSGGAWREQERRDLAGTQVFYYITDKWGNLTINQDDYEELRPMYLDLIDEWVTDGIEFKRSPIVIPADDPLYDDFRDLDREVLILARPVFHDGKRIAMLYLGIDDTFYASIIKWIVVIFSSIAFLFIIFGFLLSRWMAKRALVPVEAAYNQQREFVSNASHELRTPLSVILSAVEALDMEEDDNNPFTKKMRKTLKHEAKRMSALISELLALARTDAQNGHTELQKETFDARPLAEQVMDAFSKRCEEKNMHFHLESSESLMVHGDRNKVAQLMYILVDNAIKYTPDGGRVGIKLQQQGRKKNEEFVITVTDSGIGIAPEDKARIFDRFYRVDKIRTRKEGGYGLGLSIAKSIAVSHGGTITVDSLPDQGSSFIVAIPNPQAEEAAQQGTWNHA